MCISVTFSFWRGIVVTLYIIRKKSKQLLGRHFYLFLTAIWYLLKDKMDDRSYVKQGIRKSALPTESSLKEADGVIGIKPLKKANENSDEGFEVVVMGERNRTHSRSKDEASRVNAQANIRSRGRSRSRSSLPRQWPSFIETESCGSTCSTSSVVSVQKKEVDKYPRVSKSKPQTTPTEKTGSRLTPQSRDSSSSSIHKKVNNHSTPSRTAVDDIDILIQSALNVGFSPIDISPRRSRSQSKSKYSSPYSHQSVEGSMIQEEERKRRTSRTRSHSRCRSMGIEEYTFSAQIEPNVHDKTISSKEVKTRDISEMNENEQFARKAGLSL